MSANQPTQQTAATKFLIHTLISFGVGILFAVLTAVGNYIYTAGNAIDLKVVVTVASGAFFAYLLSHFNSDIKPNEAQLLQGINDAVTQATQNAHAPLYNAVGQLQQQVAQVAQTVQAPQVVTQSPAPPPYAPAPLPIEQQSTAAEMPAIIVSQPWQAPAPDISFGDTNAAMPAVSQ